MITTTSDDFTPPSAPLPHRLAVLLYGLAAYAVFLATFVYAIGFLGNLIVPRAIDAPARDPWWLALAVDVGLLGLFAVQHSGMARTGFKRWLARVLPPAAERSTYVLLSSLALILLFWQWRPIGGVIWEVSDPLGRGLLQAGFAAGWLLVLVTTFLINHFDLFGLRQVWTHFRGAAYRPLGFVTPGPYRLVRHPLYIGWLTVFWCTPSMTAAHLVFALATTAYILLAIRLEERDLVTAHGEAYVRYQREVPMLVPGPRARAGKAVPSATGSRTAS